MAKDKTTVGVGLPMDDREIFSWTAHAEWADGATQTEQHFPSHAEALRAAAGWIDENWAPPVQIRVEPVTDPEA